MNGNFQELLKQYNHPGDKSKYYVDEMKGAITGLIANNNALALFQDNLTLVLHGSTARNIDDQFSDIDCWIVFDDAELMKFDELCEHRYIPFVLNGKPGHMDPISINELNSCFSRININLIHEIRDAGIIIDNKKIFRDIQTIAKKPMSDEVRYAFFFHNYVQMRSSHRALDNPLERQDEIASLIGIIHTIVFALRAGLILDKVPYPFDKWLYVVSHFHPIAKSLVAPVDTILYNLKTSPHCFIGPESNNVISKDLRELREKLIHRAKEIGITDLWLEKWWRYVDPARDAITNVKWA